MNAQGSMFDLGDAAGDELARSSADGAHVAEPSLLQQGRELTASQIDADAGAAELLERHRATVAERAREDALGAACAAMAETVDRYNAGERSPLNHCIHCGRVIWRRDDGRTWQTAAGRARCRNRDFPHEPERLNP